MKMVKQWLAVAFLALAATATQAQTADEVISKHFDAIGGKDKIGQIRSVQMESTVQAMGQEGPSKITILNNKGYRLESEINGAKIIQVFTDKGGWAINPMMGGTTAQPIPDEMYKQGKDQIDVGGPLFNYAAKGYKVELVGKDSGSYQIKLTTRDSVATTFFVDQKTYYITKATHTAQMMGQQIEASFTFADFKKADNGLVNPYTITINYGGQFEVDTKVTKIDYNKDVDPKIFDMPKS